ncbi:MAG: carbon starvation protein A, partial [Elusimicrobia bacterium]|nr:carbon starvation protein A [Elusimicrobiota bacterium]
VLFGHHFSSIAGAGPIVGPILAAALWGWAPALIWVVIGSVFLGGVHDFGALVISLKHRGSSIADITKDIISRRARIIFMVFVWLALVLVIAIFAKLGAQTLAEKPSIVIPSIGIIPLALLLGYAIYAKKMNQTVMTVVALAVLTALILAGNALPLSLPNVTIWLVLLFIYSFIASITPVNILLQPRDYLSSFLLIFGMIFGVLGIFIMHPTINSEAFIAVNPPRGGVLWPMLFVTVACGAISGFHCLVSSGTTAKQIACQSDACRIGYGGMLLEGGLAVIALLSVSAGLTKGALNEFIFVSNNPIAAFTEGFGRITGKILGPYGSIFSATVLNAFILTTLDTATRIGRYLTEELFGVKNRYLSTLIVVIAAGVLTFSGSSGKIWPVFGASNQLVAALALIVISCWLLGRGKRSWVVIIPAGFMLVTSIAALVLQGISFIHDGKVILLLVIIALIICAVILLYEAGLVFKNTCLITK